MNKLIQFDSYCPDCDKERVFTSTNNKVSTGGEFKGVVNNSSLINYTIEEKIKIDLNKTNGVFAREFGCAKEHKIIFIFKIEINENEEEKFIIKKIGQLPSL